MTALPPPEFSRPHDITRLKVPVHLSATPTECAALATRLELIGLDRLEGDLRLVPGPADTLRVRGTLHADVTQTCVVTLEPVPATLTEEVDALFTTDPNAPPASEDDPDAPEPIHNGRIDLGEVLTQTLALALDPYPRKPGATFTGYEVG